MQNYRLTPNRNISLSIVDTFSEVGPDFTQYLISADGGYSGFNEGGLIARTGEIRLNKRVIGLPVLREWDFVPGCEVSLTYTNDSLTRSTQGNITFDKLLPVPIIGTWMFVEKVTTSEDDAEIILGISDGIAMCSGATPSGVEICEKDPIKEVTVAALFSTILDRIGLDKLIAGVDPLIYTLLSVKIVGPILSEVASSSLNILGQLMFMQGYNLYINNLGQLTITRKMLADISSQPSFLNVDLSYDKLLKFFRTGDGALLPTDYQVDTYDCKNIKTPLTDQKTTKDGDITTSFEITYSPADRRIRRVETVRDKSTTYSFVKETTILEEYEVGSPSGIIGGTKDCNMYDPGRLLRREITIREPIGIARAGFIAERKKAEADDPGLGTTIFTPNAIIRSSFTTEVWTYKYTDTIDATCEKLGLGSPSVPPLVPSGGNSNENLKYVKTVTQDNASIWPLAGNPRLGRDTGATIAFQFADVTTEVTTMLYRKNSQAKDNTWDLQTIVLKSRILARPAEVEAQIANDGISLSTVVGNAYQLIGDKFSTEPNTSPDEPIRFPQLHSRQCKPKCYTMTSQVNRAKNRTPKITKSISFPDHFEWKDKVETQEFISVLQRLDASRNSSYSLVGSFDSVSDITEEDNYSPDDGTPEKVDRIFAIPLIPLHTIRVKKDYIWYFMFADSPRVSISPKEMYWGCLGLLSEILPDPDAPTPSNPGGGSNVLLPPDNFRVEYRSVTDPREDTVIKGILNTLSEVYYLPE